ncbi:hypothetical protein FPG87_13255 [Flavobacterium psychrophilum]|uniref:Phage protein D n=4 Tax=Flavobacterium psychrophilum TaxID=96345 RepID=A0A7U2RBF4_FLAPS|nr:hypothetical protein [Flavobacterium psychrophilum]EKT3963248.1 hypothetical protein [Flavobacterium psychrophilum]OJH09567.1 hypothetical protein FPG87_13255 [Flavobacterium psychrophilum]QRE05284.1 hypothetical protein H0H26_06780 [Flavobacterium psychrophilum]GEJ39318.1 hypothetical protein FPN184_contig00097-0019 [Flavobacterium psychrophilum]GEJ50190.1 hypothetical protein FPKKA176_contig00063-0036 [Flavobacterium psychrophilum]
MLRLTSEIIIEGSQTWKFNALNNCTIVEDMATLTDTCELILPKRVDWQGAKHFELPIKRGDKITVKLGYDGNLKTRFVGYIRTVDAKKPVKIMCEDGMFLLKTVETKKKGYKKVALKQLITDLLAGTGIDFLLVDGDISLGSYRMLKDTVAEELNEMKSKYGLRAYFRTINGQSKLYVGLGYPFDNRKKESFIYGQNLISEDFVYRIAEDVKIKVKAISIDDKNKRTEIETGDKDGELYTVYHDNIGVDELRKFAESELKRFKTTGFKGSFETFGEPFVNKCDIAHIEASDNNKGDFLIKKVEINFGMNGYRQKIEIGQPLT